MRAKKLVVLGLVAGLIVGSLGVSAEAKKKKKKKKPVPTPVSFYIQKVKDGVCTEEGTLFLSVTPGEDNGTCGNQWYGAPYQAASEVGEGAFFANPYRMVAADGVPFVLDATKTLTGTITVKSANSLGGQALDEMGAGESTLVALVTGTSNGEAVELGSAEVTYSVTPGENPEPVSFEITLDKALDKATFTTLELSLETRGASVLHGWYASGNQSFITVPTIKKK